MKDGRRYDLEHRTANLTDQRSVASPIADEQKAPSPAEAETGQVALTDQSRGGIHLLGPCPFGVEVAEEPILQAQVRDRQ